MARLCAYVKEEKVSDTSEKGPSLAELIFIGARRMVQNPDAWREPAMIAGRIDGLKAVLTVRTITEAARTEAEALIKKLRLASKRPAGVY